MPRMTCPQCDEVVAIPSSKMSIGCPACGTDVRGASTDDVEPLTLEAEEEEPQVLKEYKKRSKKPPKKRSNQYVARHPERIKGLKPLLILGPLTLVLAVTAPFWDFATAASGLVGFPLVIWAMMVVDSIYRGPSGLLKERIGEDTHRVNLPLVLLMDSVPTSFAYPRLLACWTALQYFGFLATIMGSLSTTIFNKDAFHRQRGLVNPPIQAPAPPETDDEIITKALAELDKKEKADLSILDKLDKVKPDARRAEVARKLGALLDTKDPSPRVIKLLGIWGGPNEVPALIALFDHGLYFVRDEAIRSAGHLRDQRAIAPLVAHLKDNETAQIALIEIGPACELALLPLLQPKGEFGVLVHVLAVLKQVGTPKSLPALKELLSTIHISGAEPVKQTIDAIEARANSTPKK